jgi:hypothetical protein
MAKVTNLFPNFLYTQSSEKPKLKKKRKPLFQGGSEDEWESMEDMGNQIKKENLGQPENQIFLTQQVETKNEIGTNFLTMNEKKNDSREKEMGSGILGNENDSKISINFNINNNYLLKNQLQTDPSKSEIIKDSLTQFSAQENDQSKILI